MPPLIAFINHVLQQQGWARDLLRPHAGRAVLLQALPLELEWVIREDGLVASQASVRPSENGSHQRFSPDVTLRVSLAVLLLLRIRQIRQFFSGLRMKLAPATSRKAMPRERVVKAAVATER